ncbi:hypothetical protein C0995_004045 [Termitomyces sp. Mi166|nr:hypothetical protein C0995_004045 [Termitomyces sp. Mi166\
MWAGRLQLEVENGQLHVLELNGQQIPARTYSSIQWSAVSAKDPARAVPKPLVIVVHINGHSAHALVDSGSLGDFIFSMLAQQLGIKKTELTSPVPVQLAISKAPDLALTLAPQQKYDLILGTPLAMQFQWPKKRNAYIKSGHWKIMSSAMQIQ